MNAETSHEWWVRAAMTSAVAMAELAGAGMLAHGGVTLREWIAEMQP